MSLYLFTDVLFIYVYSCLKVDSCVYSFSIIVRDFLFLAMPLRGGTTKIGHAETVTSKTPATRPKRRYAHKPGALESWKNYGTFAPRNFRSLERKFHGTFAPGSEYSMELSLPRSKVTCALKFLYALHIAEDLLTHTQTGTGVPLPPKNMIKI